MSLPDAPNLSQAPDMTSVWLILGFSIFFHAGTFVTVMGIAAKFIWSWAKMDSRVEKNHLDVNAAFVKIRDLENKLYNNRPQ